MAEKLNREDFPDACPSCGGALWMQSMDCCVKEAAGKVEEVEEVVEEAPTEEPKEEKPVEKPKKKATPKKKAAKKA